MLLLGIEIETCEVAMEYLGMPSESLWVRLGTSEPVRKATRITRINIRAAQEAQLGPIHLETPTSSIAQWDGFAFDMWGRIVPSPQHERRPLWDFRVGAGILVEVWYARAFADGGRVEAQAFWSPLQGEFLAITRAGPGWDVTRLKQAARVVKVLEIFGAAKGRRLGTGDFPDEPTFRFKVEPVVRSLRKDRGRATRDHAAEMLHIRSDYLRDLTHDLTGLTWPEFVKTLPDQEGEN